jgi:hypothetical protein
MGVLAMNRSLFGPRRAERFAQLLDEAEGARRRHSRSRADQHLAGLVAVSRRTGQIPLEVEADPEFRIGLRAMLMATIEREGLGATAIDPEPTMRMPAARHRRVPTSELVERVRPDRRPAGAVAAQAALSRVRSRRARAAVVVGLAAGTLAVSGMSAASGDAIPGDALYSIKRSTEKAQLALAGSDVTRGQLYLEFAKTRMNEANAVRGDLAGLTAVLGDMDNETREGVRLLTTAATNRRDTAPLDTLDAFGVVQRPVLVELVNGLHGPARERGLASLALLDNAKLRSAGLRTSVRSCGGRTGGVDELGPLPRVCRTERGSGPSVPKAPAGSTPVAATPRPSASIPDSTGGTSGGVSPPGATASNPAEGRDQRHDGIVDPTSQVFGNVLG